MTIRGRTEGSLIVAMMLTIAVACSPGGGSDVQTAAPEPPSAVTEADVVNIFDAVSVLLLEDTRVLNQVAVSASADDQARADSAALVEQIVASLEGQLEVVEMLDPVPQTVGETQRLTKLALARYIEAARLLLPPVGDANAPFDFLEYQAVMNEAGETFHDAGFALPMGSASKAETDA